LKERLKKSFNLKEITENGKALKMIPIEIEYPEMLSDFLRKEMRRK
jgi:hypothetical protein